VRPRRRYAIAAGLASLALLAAGCGGDDNKDNSATATTAAGAATTATTTATTAASSTSTTAGPAPTSIAEWEALWAKERTAIIQRIKDNHWGKSADGKTLTGPEGWTVDLTKCAPGWSDTEGITDTTIKIGQSISLSGTYADYGNLGRAIEFLFGYYNDQNFFKDASGKTRKVLYTMKDDGYDAARAIPNVDELLDSEKSFAIWTLGTPATLKTYDKINQRCVPQPIAMTAHAAWGDPVNHPWTSGAPNPTYSTESVLWGSFIEQHLSEFPTDRKIKVASLVQNNDFGKLYDSAFKAFIAESSKLKDRINYVSETIEASAPTVTDPMTTLAAENPDIWITMLAGTQCTQIVNEAAQNGMKAKAKYLFMPQTCPGATFIGKEKLGGDGSAGDGWWLLSNGVKDTKDPAFANDPYIKWLKEAMAAKGINPDTSINYAGGINYGFPVIQALKIAGELDGGLTRTNFLLALRSIDMTPPMLLQGIRLHMNGLKDAYIVEAGQFMKWNAAKQTYEFQGNLINLDGKAKLCAWDQSVSTCK
jgi:ABC-type branched-subunit amino acid transport system substrate-binding protein